MDKMPQWLALLIALHGSTATFAANRHHIQPSLMVRRRKVHRAMSETTEPRLYLREHREAKNIGASEMAERLGIERESLYRLERNADRIDWRKACEYAVALGVAPVELLNPPGTISIDAMLANMPVEYREAARDILVRLVGASTGSNKE